MKSDTIAAIATAMTPAGIGIIRISGEDAFKIIDKIYKSKKGNKLLSQCDSHTVHYGFIFDAEDKIDEVMVLLMKAPNTYTREDTVEIDCHGGVYVMKRILETVIKNGARPAEPGEFTKRAFLNGRIDLTQAESVIDVINVIHLVIHNFQQFFGIIIQRDMFRIIQSRFNKRYFMQYLFPNFLDIHQNRTF